ncbi:sulfotransferase [Rheinheimera sp.]|uniref:tetratricopeptide repeat-containing sulfotransferase family protein n=1 Tax=Rheinheimera sp. TaxID=1869214 RepID=UPI00307EF88E
MTQAHPLYQTDDLMAAVRAGRRAEAQAILQYLAGLSEPQNKLPLAAVAIGIGELALARLLLDQFRQRKEMTLNELLQCAGLYAEAGQPDLAIQLVQPQAQQGLPYPGIYHLLGTAKSQTGAIAAAVTELKKALSLSPQSGISWLTLASMVNFAKDEQAFSRLSAAYQQHLQPAQAEARHFHYAMAKAWDDRGDYQQAWQCYQQGAALAAAQSRYQPAEHQQFVQQLMADSQWPNPKRQHRVVAAKPPVAILGVPRSGTTLLGQMLGCHSALNAAAEHPALAVSCMHLSRSQLSQFNQYLAVHGAPGAALEHMAALYLRLAGERTPGQGAIVDKALNLTQYFDIWATLFPQGKAIYIRRDDAETAWSCYKTNFRQQADWSWRADDIASYLRLERQLMQHWLALYPERILTVDYADLLNSPEQTLRRICQHLQLPFEPAMLSFYQNRAPVQTASVGQVHQPLFTPPRPAAERYPEFFRQWQLAWHMGQGPGA